MGWQKVVLNVCGRESFTWNRTQAVKLYSAPLFKKVRCARIGGLIHMKLQENFCGDTVIGSYGTQHFVTKGLVKQPPVLWCPLLAPHCGPPAQTAIYKSNIY
jgi:hypothetical protein